MTWVQSSCIFLEPSQRPVAFHLSIIREKLHNLELSNAETNHSNDEADYYNMNKNIMEECKERK